MKFLDLESRRLFEVSAYSRLGAYDLFFLQTWLDLIPWPQGRKWAISVSVINNCLQGGGIGPMPSHNLEDQGFLSGWPSLSHYIHYL